MTHPRLPTKHHAPLPTRRALLGFLLGLCTLAGRAARAESTAEFRVLVNPENPASSLSRDFITDIFLKRTTRWHDGETAHPADQRADAAVRKSFSDAVLRRSVSAIKRYWQQRIFSGRDLPPPELDSDEAIVSYVLKHRGAIGYVTSGAKLGRAKPVSIQ